MENASNIEWIHGRILKEEGNYVTYTIVFAHAYWVMMI